MGRIRDQDRGVSAGSLGRLRERNRLQVIEALARSGTASRAGLARTTALSRTTVAAVVSDLIARGLVVEVPQDQASTGRGRPPVMLRLDASAGAAVGLDFGHTHLRVAVADLGSNVRAERHVPLDVDHEGSEALAAAARLVAEVLDEAGIDRGRVVGAGVGLPGPIDRRTGVISTSVIMPGWEGLVLPTELSDALGLEVEIDNDANLGALGEVSFGAARGLADVVYVKIASGIGAGLIVGGRLHRGVIGVAGEIGHVTVEPEGAICACGNRGCLQTVASTRPLLDQLRTAHGPNLSTQDLLALVAAGDWAARRVLADAGRAIGRVLGQVCNCLNPEAVVVGGELSAAGEPLLDGIREGIDRHALPAAAQAVEVRPGILGDRAEVLGALALVIADTERLRSAGLASLHDPVVGVTG